MWIWYLPQIFLTHSAKKKKIKIKESKKYIDKNSYEKVILKMNNIYMSHNQEEIIIPVI